MSIDIWKFDSIIYSSDTTTDIDYNVKEINTAGMLFTVSANTFTMSANSRINLGAYTVKFGTSEVLSLPLSANAGTYYFYIVRDAPQKKVTFEFSTSVQSGSFTSKRYIEIFRYVHGGGTINLGTSNTNTNLVINTSNGLIPLKQYTQLASMPTELLPLTTTLEGIKYSDATDTLIDIPRLLNVVSNNGLGTMRENYISSTSHTKLVTEIRTYLNGFGYYGVSNTLSIIYESYDYSSPTINVGAFKITSQNTSTYFIDFTIPFYNGVLQRPMADTQTYSSRADVVDLNTIISGGTTYCTTATNYPNGASAFGMLTVKIGNLNSLGERQVFQTWQSSVPGFEKVTYQRTGYFIEQDGTPGTSVGAKWNDWYISGGFTMLFSNRANPLTNASLDTTVIPNILVYKTIEIYYSPNLGGERPRWVVMQRRDDGTFEGNMPYNVLGGNKYDVTISLAWDSITNKCIYKLAYLTREAIPTGDQEASDVISGTFIYEIIGKELII